jgi:TolB protein
MRGVTAVAAAVLAAVVLSACGSSGHAPVVAPHAKVHEPGAIVFVAGGPSHGFGVDNTDLLAATPGGHVHDLTSSPAAESDATWSADGSHVIFVRQSTAGHANGTVTFQAGLYLWSPGHGAPRQVVSCSQFCPQRDFSWSPDDRHIAFVSRDNAIEVMNANGGGVRKVCDDKRCGQGLAMPLWSPDGSKLVFSNEGVNGFMGPVSLTSSVWIANADGSGVEKLTQPNCKPAYPQSHGCALDGAPAWSPDGRLISFSRHSSQMVVAPAATSRQPITTKVEVMHADGSHLHSIYNCSGDACNQILPADWAPDGKAIAYLPNVVRDPSFRLSTLAGKTTTIRTCTGSRCLVPDNLAWSPNGTQLAFFAGGGVWRIDRDGEAMHRVAVGAEWGSLAWVGHVSLSGAKAVPKIPPAAHLHLSGTIAYDDESGALDSSLDLLSLSTARTHALRLASTQQSVEPAWSPDGREIAFGGVGPRANTNVYVADRSGNHVRVLTRFRGGATQPAWSPDGRTIAFEEDGIRLVSAAGGHIRSLTSDGTYPSWSPSGSELVFERHLGSGNSEALFTIRPDGSGVRRLTNLPGEQRSPVWSPNGKEIAFEWWTPAGTGLYLIRPDGTHLRRVTTVALLQGRPAWSPNSRYLAVLSADGGATSTRVLVIDVASGRVSTVATVPGYAANPSWSSR